MHGSADLLDFSVFCFILCTSKVGMHIDIDMLLSYIPFYICLIISLDSAKHLKVVLGLFHGITFIWMLKNFGKHTIIMSFPSPRHTKL